MLMEMEEVDPIIEKSWKSALHAEFKSPYFRKLKMFLVEERSNHLVYPPGKDIFNAFNSTPFMDVKVVILGQDPYHGPGQAHGLSFSVPEGVRPPPSLMNIFKEMQSDLSYTIPRSGNLTSWARQGVLLLNATLTVRAKQAGSHQGKGWERFTDQVIAQLSKERSGLVFLLWGRFAQAKQSLVDMEKHHVLTAAHPSPFSAYNGFFGCKHFSRTNELLLSQGDQEIDWSLE
jgi:uracil-DNA glycosylase